MFTPEDKKLLRLFCETFDDLVGCRFLRNLPKLSHHIFVGALRDGRVVDEYPRYDDDDFRAFMTHYRKLRLEQDLTNLFRIMKLLKQKGGADDMALLDHLKNEIKEEGRTWWGAVDHDENGDQKYLTQEEVEKLILYGEVIHSNRKDDLKRVIGKNSYLKAAAFFNYMRFARTVIYCAQKMTELIRSRGYLV
jgi:hypothetical protein